MGIARICGECHKVIERIAGNGRGKKRDSEIVSICADCREKARRELAPSGFPRRRCLVTKSNGEAYYLDPAGPR